MIMGGSKDATLQSVQQVNIHGTRFFDIAYSHDEAPGSIRTARVGAESIYTNPQPGDGVRISYLMNVVTEITRR